MKAIKTKSGRIYTKRQIQEAIQYWEDKLARIDESAISDFFGKLFRTKSFIAKQDELLKQKNYKEHPLMEVADKMAREIDSDYKVRFTNVDVENDGYPQTFSDTYDCIAIAYRPADYHDLASGVDKKYVMNIAKACGLSPQYSFYGVDGSFGVITQLKPGMTNIVNVNESDEEFEEIDDIVKWCKDKNVKWKEIYKTAPIKILRKPKAGEEVKTIASDGTEEVINKAKDDSWVVCNAGNDKNFWLVREKVIKADYVSEDGEEIEDVEEGAVYRPKTKSEGGEGRMYAPIADYCDKGVQFSPPNWGGAVISVKGNGYFMRMPNDEKDIYGISIVDFETTYKPR